MLFDNIPELKADGKPFGSFEYFDAKRKGTVFKNCESGSGSEVDCDKMIKKFCELTVRQFREIQEDFDKAKESLLIIPSSDRKNMGTYITALENVLSKLGVHNSFNTSRLKQCLDENKSPYSVKPAKPTSISSKNTRKPTGKNGKEICSRDYIDKLTHAIFGSSGVSFRGSSSDLTNAVSKDARKIIDSIHSDLEKALKTVCRVKEANKKNIINAVKRLDKITSTGKGWKVIDILDYTEEITIPPAYGVLSGTSIAKPIKIFSKELLRGHQNFEEFLKKAGPSIAPYNRRVIIEAVEKYEMLIPAKIKVALEIDNTDEVVNIVFYLDGKEIYRTIYKEMTYKAYTSGYTTSLHAVNISVSVLRGFETAIINNSWVNDAVSWAGERLEELGIVGEIIPPTAEAYSPEIYRSIKGGSEGLKLSGQLLQNISDAYDFSKDIADKGDIKIYYGKYGGFFDRKTFALKGWYQK